MIREFYIKYKIFIIPLAVGLICLIITIFIIVPQVAGLFSEREKIGILTNRIDLLNNKAAALEKLDESQIQKDLITALTVLPTERDVPQAMVVLQGIIAKSNLVLQSTSYAAGIKTAGQDSFSLTISVAGNISSTRDFLNNLREGSRIFKVESISLRIDPQSSSAITDLPLAVFYQPAPAAALTIDQPVAKIGDKEEELIKNLSKFAFQEPAVATSSTASSISVGKTNPFE